MFMNNDTFSMFDLGLFGFNIGIPLWVVYNIACAAYSGVAFYHSSEENGFAAAWQAAMSTLKNKSANGVVIFCAMALFCCTYFNIAAIFPFNFTPTTLPSFVMYIAVTPWATFYLFTAFQNHNKLISHNVPEGAPKPLVFPIFLLEVISDHINPITLTLRLCGNITVGHVLMALCFNAAEWFFPFSLLYLLLSLVEIGVCLIQAYIFHSLIVLCAKEV